MPGGAATSTDTGSDINSSANIEFQSLDRLLDAEGPMEEQEPGIATYWCRFCRCNRKDCPCSQIRVHATAVSCTDYGGGGGGDLSNGFNSSTFENGWKCSASHRTVESLDQDPGPLPSSVHGGLRLADNRKRHTWTFNEETGGDGEDVVAWYMDTNPWSFFTEPLAEQDPVNGLTHDMQELGSSLQVNCDSTDTDHSMLSSYASGSSRSSGNMSQLLRGTGGAVGDSNTHAISHFRR